MKPQLTYRVGQIALISREITALMRQQAEESDECFNTCYGDDLTPDTSKKEVEVQIDCIGGETIYATVIFTALAERECAATRLTPAEWEVTTSVEISNIEVHDQYDNCIEFTLEDPRDTLIVEYYSECA